MRKRGGGSHQQPQNIHAAGVGEQLDLFEGINGLDVFHFD
jgi:hypothetical protein